MDRDRFQPTQKKTNFLPAADHVFLLLGWPSSSMTSSYRGTLVLVKSGTNNRLALLSEAIYIIFQIQATKSGSIKRLELLTEVFCIGLSVVVVLRDSTRGI